MVVRSGVSQVRGHTSGRQPVAIQHSASGLVPQMLDSAEGILSANGFSGRLLSRMKSVVVILLDQEALQPPSTLPNIKDA